MKLYYHPASTVCRPIMLFAADHVLDLDYELVDLFTGENLQPRYVAINPSRQVPVLEDGHFRLSESSAILKYLAEKKGSPTYPRDLRERARVNECMDWLNTGLYRDLGYGLVYPQAFPNHRRPDALQNAGVVAWARDKAARWLDTLDRHFIGAHDYVCSDQISIADYFAVGIVTLGEVIRLDYSPYPNVSRWLARMKARPAYGPAHAAFDVLLVQPHAAAQFVGLQCVNG